MNFAKLFRPFSVNIIVYGMLYMLYTVFAFNYIFFAKIYTLSQSMLFTAGAFVVVWILLTLCGFLLFWKHTVKILSVFFLLLNSGVFYFADTFHAAVDEEMLRNVLETNVAETAELLTLKLLLYVVLLGVLPSLFVCRLNITCANCLVRRGQIFLLLCLVAAALVVPNSSEVISFARNHKPVKYSLIPVNYIGAVISMTKHNLRSSHEFMQIGTDSQFYKYWKNDKPLLIAVIVGETARAANFSLNGYGRPTNEPLNPYRDDIINFTNASSCGTSTAVSVPCMFSKDSRKDFENGSAEYTENVLDIFRKNGWRAWWLENNSDCKNVCSRIEFMQPCVYPKKCLDDVLLRTFSEKISAGNPQNTIAVFHGIGSHGPAYYKRYPADSEKFLPTCKTEKLDSCSREEIVNTYDNTIYYTSQNIAELWQELKKYEDRYNVFLLYVSDHGESLGEYGLYLHSAPYKIAPEEQTHIPFLLFLDERTAAVLSVDRKCLLKKSAEPVSHDNIFHSLLGISGISATEYNSQLDLFSDCRK